MIPPRASRRPSILGTAVLFGLVGPLLPTAVIMVPVFPFVIAGLPDREGAWANLGVFPGLFILASLYGYIIGGIPALLVGALAHWSARHLGDGSALYVATLFAGLVTSGFWTGCVFGHDAVPAMLAIAFIGGVTAVVLTAIFRRRFARAAEALHAATP